jgi:putative oxidoreductase
MGFEGTSGFFTSLFGGAGPFLAGLVAGIEVLAGIALIVSIWTRWASYLLTVILLVAIVWAKKFAWPAIELDLVLVGSLLALAWNGPGKWSLHSSCGCCKDGCNC